MNNYEFLDLFLENFLMYYFSLFIVIVIYFILLRKLVISILDPMVLSVLGSVFGFSVVLFLYLCNEITFFYFASYILTQFAFLFSFLYFGTSSGVNNSVIVKFPDNRTLHFTIFVISSIIFLLCQLYVYKTIGIPLLMDSRLEMFIDGSGSGILGRFIDVCSFISLYLIFHILLNGSVKSFLFKFYIYIIIAFFIMFSILSGSKSVFLTFGSAFFVFVIVNPNLTFKNIEVLSYLKKNEYKVIVLGLIIAILVIIIQSKEDIGNSFLTFYYRLVGYGDVYWYAYPSGTIEQLNGDSPFYALFTDFLGMFRIVSWDKLPNAIGIDLYQMFHPTDLIQGPNARHNVFGYVYFGFLGSIIFSGILGMIIGLVRKKIFILGEHTMITKLFFALIYSKIFTLETDPMLAITYLNSIFVVFPIIIFISLILNPIKLK